LTKSKAKLIRSVSTKINQFNSYGSAQYQSPHAQTYTISDGDSDDSDDSGKTNYDSDPAAGEFMSALTATDDQGLYNPWHLTFRQVMEQARHKVSAPSTLAWITRYWMHLEDIYHTRNDLLNAIGHYKSRKSMWKLCTKLVQQHCQERETSSNARCSRKSLHYFINRCAERDETLMQRCLAVLNELHETTMFAKIRNKLDEIDRAFIAGSLSQNKYM
jgi:hypothetical protein